MYIASQRYSTALSNFVANIYVFAYIYVDFSSYLDPLEALMQNMAHQQEEYSQDILSQQIVDISGRRTSTGSGELLLCSTLLQHPGVVFAGFFA